MGKMQGDKIPQLSVQGSGKSPSPAPPAKLSVPVFSAGTTSVSTARCSQQQSNSCTIQAATEWLNSSLQRHGVIKTWCSFVLYKAPTLLTPSSNLTGYQEKEEGQCINMHGRKRCALFWNPSLCQELCYILNTKAEAAFMSIRRYVFWHAGSSTQSQCNSSLLFMTRHKWSTFPSLVMLPSRGYKATNNWWSCSLIFKGWEMYGFSQFPIFSPKGINHSQIHERWEIPFRLLSRTLCQQRQLSH